MNKILCKIGIPLLLLLLLFILITSSRNPLAEIGGSRLRRGLLNNPLALHLLHTYHSLRKLPDLAFFPFNFYSSKLRLYNLNIQTDKIAFLNSNLNSDPINGQLRNDNRTWAKAVFSAGEYKDTVKVRYRGTNVNHWNSYQKSWRINFPKGHYFDGMKALNLVIPYDRNYFVESLNYYRGGKLGLTVPDMHFVRLRLNGEDMGVYLAFEQWSDQWLKKTTAPENAMILGADDGRNPQDTTVDVDSVAIKMAVGDAYFKRYSSSVYVSSFETLVNIIDFVDDDTFKKIIGTLFDLKKFYAWNVVDILAGGGHFDDRFGNIIIIFNPATGRFEFSPWDIGIGQLTGDNPAYQDNALKLSRRILRVPEFRDERNAALAAYIQNKDNLRDDLDFYDKLWQQTKVDFFKDNAKLYNNFQLINQIKWFRQLIMTNYSQAQAVLSYDSAFYAADDKERREAVKPLSAITLPPDYNRLSDVISNIDQFIAANPSFVKTGKSMVSLPAGRHLFKRDTIIPTGLRVIIEPGATLYLDKKVSLLSYSPIEARGSLAQPIRVLRSTVSEPWGVFAVLNSGERPSIFQYVEFDGGSGAVINGVTFTGMVAVHNGNAEITNSVFKNSGDDDALNLKYGRLLLSDSVFQDTSADAVDTDFAAEQTVIKNSKFYNIGRGGSGDGIDISWSNITIADNLIENCTDKGISIGESSRPKVSGTRINHCDIGVAVKDSSTAIVANTEILNSRVGIAVYQKKKSLNGGMVQLKDVKLINNAVDYEKDDLSVINIVK